MVMLVKRSLMELGGGASRSINIPKEHTLCNHNEALELICDNIIVIIPNGYSMDRLRDDLKRLADDLGFIKL